MLLETKLLMAEELMKSIAEEKRTDWPMLLSEDPIVDATVSFIRDNGNDIARLGQICDAVGVTKERLYSRFIQNMLIPYEACPSKAHGFSKGSLFRHRELCGYFEEIWIQARRVV